MVIIMGWWTLVATGAHIGGRFLKYLRYVLKGSCPVWNAVVGRDKFWISLATLLELGHMNAVLWLCCASSHATGEWFLISRSYAYEKGRPGGKSGLMVFLSLLWLGGLSVHCTWHRVLADKFSKISNSSCMCVYGDGGQLHPLTSPK